MRKDNTQTLLTLAIAACIALAGIRVVKFVAGRVPPYSVGTCIGLKSQLDVDIQFKIVKNNLLGGYSEIDASSRYIHEKLQASFSDLRTEPELVQTKCLEDK